MIKHSAYALGATLYMPATRPDILDVVLGEKIQGLRSLVVCLEDAVAETDVQQGLNNLKNLLLGIEARARQGTAAHPDAEAIARMARPVAELGWAIASGAVPALADAPAAAH